jgi:hypothetical protein
MYPVLRHRLGLFFFFFSFAINEQQPKQSGPPKPNERVCCGKSVVDGPPYGGSEPALDISLEQRFYVYIRMKRDDLHTSIIL